jgi:hypothetical protein
MLDLIFVAALIALTCVAALLIAGCDKLLGPDERALGEDARDSAGREDSGRVTADRAWKPHDR